MDENGRGKRDDRPSSRDGNRRPSNGNRHGPREEQRSSSSNRSHNARSHSRSENGNGRPHSGSENGTGSSYSRSENGNGRPHSSHSTTSSSSHGYSNNRQNESSENVRNRSESQNRNGAPKNHDGDQSRKRGRDLNDVAGQSRRSDKVQKANPGEARKKREEFFDQIITKPENLDTRGNGRGNVVPVRLSANFFRVERKQGFTVTRYRVDFQPDTEIPGLKRRLIGQHRATLGGYLFDGGNQIFLMSPLPPTANELRSTDRDDNEFTVSLKMTGEIRYTDGMFLQVLNLVMRNAMRGLNLQLVGRNFYDAAAAVSQQLKFELKLFN